MKHFFILIIFSPIISHSFCQESRIKLWIVDNGGRSDTIEFGLHSEATVGIDTILGEVDYYSAPFDTLKIRSIQRDSFNHHCLNHDIWGYSDISPIYFNTNHDLKIDYRDSKSENIKNKNFEILLSTRDFPASIYLDAKDIGSLNKRLLALIKDNECNIMIIDGIIDKDNIPNPPYLYLEEKDSTINTLVFIADVDFDYIKDINLNTLRIYPTITRDIIKIEHNETLGNCNVELINLMGQIVFREELCNNNNIINLSGIGEGIFIIKIYDLEKNVVIFKNKILKY